MRFMAVLGKWSERVVRLLDKERSLQLCKKILLSKVAVAFLSMNPEDTAQVARCESQLSPVPALISQPAVVGTCPPCSRNMRAYLRPSLYRSYAVEERKLRDKPTTKPKTVRRVAGMPTKETLAVTMWICTFDFTNCRAPSSRSV
jgi:hypothetical protein